MSQAQIITIQNEIARKKVGENRELIPGKIAYDFGDGYYNVDADKTDQDGNSVPLVKIPPAPSQIETKYNVGDAVTVLRYQGKDCQTEILGPSNITYPDETICDFSTVEESTCFLAGTLIKALSGEIEIEKIKKDMVVFGYDEKLKKIVQCRVNKLLTHDKENEKVLEYYLLKTKNSEVKVTKNHPFYTKNNNYKQIQQITDYIYLSQNNDIVKEQIISKELIQTAPVITYNLSLALSSPCNYFANRYLVHNVFSK
jgi:hypothetical protein